MDKLKLLSLGIIVLFTSSFSTRIKTITPISQPIYSSINTAKARELPSNVEVFAHWIGKWRGKGYFLWNGDKRPFDITQWVGMGNEERVNIHGFIRAPKEKQQDFHRSIFSLKKEQKTVIGFYLRENILIQADFTKMDNADWHYAFEDEQGVKFRYTWHIENDNLWVESAEVFIVKDWVPYCKVVLTKE